MSSTSDFDTCITLTVFVLSTSTYIISMSGIAMIKCKPTLQVHMFVNCCRYSKELSYYDISFEYL